MKINKGQIWNIKRTIVEEFQVWATSKESALKCEKEPNKITVIKEIAKPAKLVKV